jgi:hypothetical protein
MVMNVGCAFTISVQKQDFNDKLHHYFFAVAGPACSKSEVRLKYLKN